MIKMVMNSEVIQAIIVCACVILQLGIIFALKEENVELKNKIKELEEKTEK